MIYILPVIYLAFSLYWLVVAALTLRDGLKASRLPAEDKPHNRAWTVFALAAVGLVLAGVPIVVAWVAKNWVVAPFDFDEDTTGTSLLFDACERIFMVFWVGLAMTFAMPFVVAMLSS